MKYRIRLERVEMIPEKKAEWVKLRSDSPEYGYAPEREVETYNTTEVLNMEWRQEIDLRDVVAAILDMPRRSGLVTLKENPPYVCCCSPVRIAQAEHCYSCICYNIKLAVEASS